MYDEELIRELVRRTEKTRSEHVAVDYGDRYVVVRGSTENVCFAASCDVRHIVHTHTAPRSTPSVMDVITAWSLSRTCGRSIPLSTVTKRRDGKIVVYTIEVSPDMTESELKDVVRELMPFERLVAMSKDDEQTLEVLSEAQHIWIGLHDKISIRRHVIENERI